jgi:PIN domain nuclease of toxin-antitoxin system
VRFLADTHTFVWATTDDERLGRAVRRVLADPSSEILLSLASVWEMAIKASLGKLELRVPVGTYVETQLAETGIALYDITLDHVVRVAELPLHHRDPFDRLLIAQALCDDLILLSADESFDAYGVRRRW